MGLFINDSQHPGVFRNAGELNEPNQSEFRRDYLSELIKEQQTSNKSFHRAIYGLRNSHNKISQRQIKQWREIDKQLNDLKELNQRHEKLEHEVLDWLQKLEVRNLKLQMIMRNEQLVKKNIIGQVESLGQSQEEIIQRLSQFEGSNGEVVERLNEFGEKNSEIASRLDQFGVANEDVVQRLEQFGLANEQMMMKLDNQYDLHKHVAEQISNIEETQKEVLNRVDNQEGLMEKAIRQIDNVRSILFERTNFLEEKIEKVYNFTTSYIQKFKTTSSGQQMTLVMKKRKDDEEVSED